MVDDAFVRGFSQQIYDHWIGPELEARATAGALPADFRPRRCLIRLPQGARPIVEFNSEVRLAATAKVPDGRQVEAGQVACLEDIERIESVDPPTVNGVAVAFIYIHWVHDKYHIFFDFSPNHPQLAAEQRGKEWEFSKPLAQTLQATLIEQALSVHDAVREDLRKIGLWAAPALLPYPLSKIAALVKQGDEQQARNLLVGYCTPSHLADLVASWWTVPQFHERRKLFEQALKAHGEGSYFLSVSALSPQLEGVITDWVFTKAANVPWKQDSKTAQFRDLAAAAAHISSAHKRVIESAVEFILRGPVLETFKQWFDSFDTSFPNRHVVGHGRYDEKLFSEENSAKLFLMLDTVCQIMMFTVTPASG